MIRIKNSDNKSTLSIGGGGGQWSSQWERGFWIETSKMFRNKSCKHTDLYDQCSHLRLMICFSTITRNMKCHGPFHGRVQSATWGLSCCWQGPWRHDMQRLDNCLNSIIPCKLENAESFPKRMEWGRSGW